LVNPINWPVGQQRAIFTRAQSCTLSELFAQTVAWTFEQFAILTGNVQVQ
jgi:hypothetical protein